MTRPAHLVQRDGRFWCLLHKTWWKECPCPGDVSMTAPITQEMIDAMKPNPCAYIEAIERALAQADGEP